MLHNIIITSLYDHGQEFEVHGWNKNQSMTVSAGDTSVISAVDGSSGAIIALHYSLRESRPRSPKIDLG